MTIEHTSELNRNPPNREYGPCVTLTRDQIIELQSCGALDYIQRRIKEKQ